VKYIQIIFFDFLHTIDSVTYVSSWHSRQCP